MQCPRCPNSSLKPMTYEGVEIDFCPTCQGHWLDQGELSEIVETKEQKFSAQEIADTFARNGTGIPPHEQNKILKCPKCATGMTKTNYSYSSGIIIDRCPKNHGVWMDGQELNKAQAFDEKWDEEAVEHEAEWTEKANKARKEAQATVNAIESQSGFMVRLISKIFRI
ncbi:MAG: zf-TFIIB domain-containing protein [Pseudomonadota bacterium]